MPIHRSTGHRAAIYTLAAADVPDQILSAGGDGWVAAWSVAQPDTGQLVASVEGQIFSLLPLPATPWLLVGTMQGGVHWINRQYPDHTRNVQAHRKGVFDLQAMDEWVLSAGGDGLLTRWEVAQARRVESVQLSHAALRTVAYAPKRRELAVGASDGNIYLLDAATWAVKRVLTAAHLPSVFTVAYAPDERYLLSGGRDAHLNVWDIEADFALCSRQPAHWFTINHLTFSPDGAQFATASRDKTIKIWDARTFQLQKVLDLVRDNGHRNAVNRLLWREDYLISASDDRTLLWWKR